MRVQHNKNADRFCVEFSIIERNWAGGKLMVLDAQPRRQIKIATLHCIVVTYTRINGAWAQPSFVSDMS